MPCNNQTGDYLSYNCYSTLKSYFDTSQLTDTGKKILNETIEKLKGSSPRINMNHIIFNDFARYLTKHHNFLTYGYPVSCKYINFWLNDQVKSKYSSEFESKFQVFVDFEREFVTEGIKYHYPNNLCKSYIKEIDGDEYRKKEILYKLYHYYTEHKKPTNYQNPEPLCYLINLIIVVSRGAKNYIDDDQDFAKLLRELKVLIQNEKHHKEKCHYSMLKNMLPEEESKTKVEEVPVIPVDKTTLPIPQHENLEHVEGDINGTAQTVLTGTVELPKESMLQEEESHTVMTPPQTIQEELSFRVSQEGYPLDRTMSQENPLFRTWHQQARPLKQEREITQTVDHLYGDTQHARSDKRGVLGTIQNTFSDVLGSVDPVPVVGVSGGMGALFLLFRYTPFGNFFRGGRGRAQRLPRTFNGQFLGAFPDIQDYESGYIGYGPTSISSLAE